MRNSTGIHFVHGVEVQANGRHNTEALKAEIIKQDEAE